MDNSSIILEMFERIKKLELEVDILKSKANINQTTKVFNSESNTVFNYTTKDFNLEKTVKTRDTTRFMFEKNIYLKNKLVLAVIKKYVEDNPYVLVKELKSIFNKSLQGSIGVVEEVAIAKERKDCNVRFFTKEEDVVQLIDGEVYVCNQWGVLNLPNFIANASQLGYLIESVNKQL